jgi:hypothetical protein
MRIPHMMHRLRLQAQIQAMVRDLGADQAWHLIERVVEIELGKYSNETPTVHSHTPRSVE